MSSSRNSAAGSKWVGSLAAWRFGCSQLVAARARAAGTSMPIGLEAEPTMVGVPEKTGC